MITIMNPCIKYRWKSRIFFSSRRRNTRTFVCLLALLLALLLVECVFSPAFNLSNKVSTWMCEKNCRPDTCDGCLKHDFTYLINNSSICRLGANRKIDLIILIMSEHNQHFHRNVLRETWLSITKQNSANVRYAFLLGASKNRKLMRKVYKENMAYGDILMEDFTDSYLNLTHKTIMGIKWAATYCRHARYFLKTDQDVWVNVPGLLDVLSTRSAELQNSIGGLCTTYNLPFRFPFSKWYTTFSDYPHITYPSYCSGHAYVTSMTVINKMNRIYPNVPFFKWEDVYVTLCLQQGNLGVTNIPRFKIQAETSDPCTIAPDILTVHGASSDHMIKYMGC